MPFCDCQIKLATSRPHGHSHGVDRRCTHLEPWRPRSLMTKVRDAQERSNLTGLPLETTGIENRTPPRPDHNIAYLCLRMGGV